MEARDLGRDVVFADDALMRVPSDTGSCPPVTRKRRVVVIIRRPCCVGGKSIKVVDGCHG